MILVDSSCWVEFYRPGGEPAVQAAVLEAVRTGQAALCSMVQVEIIGYIKRRREYEMVAGDFEALLWLETTRKEVKVAVEMGRALRTRGMTVPPSDLLIAGVAGSHDALLLHSDRHFEHIATHCPSFHQEFVGV